MEVGLETGVRLQYGLAKREETDRRVSFGLAIFLSIITLGFYSAYLTYVLIQRRDKHFARQRQLADALYEFICKQAEARGIDVMSERQALQAVILEMSGDEQERGAAVWAVLSFFLVPAWLYVAYFLMRDMHRHDEREIRLVRAASDALVKIGAISASLAKVPSVPRRGFWLYLALSVVTFGIFILYWLYCLVRDGNRHFDAQEGWEEPLALAVRS